MQMDCTNFEPEMRRCEEQVQMIKAEFSDSKLRFAIDLNREEIDIFPHGVYFNMESSLVVLKAYEELLQRNIIRLNTAKSLAEKKVKQLTMDDGGLSPRMENDQLKARTGGFDEDDTIIKPRKLFFDDVYKSVTSFLF